MSLYIYVYLMTKDEDNKCIKLHNNGWSKEEWCMNVVRKKRKNNNTKKATYSGIVVVYCRSQKSCRKPYID